MEVGGGYLRPGDGSRIDLTRLGELCKSQIRLILGLIIRRISIIGGQLILQKVMDN